MKKRGGKVYNLNPNITEFGNIKIEVYWITEVEIKS